MEPTATRAWVYWLGWLGWMKWRDLGSEGSKLLAVKSMPTVKLI